MSTPTTTCHPTPATALLPRLQAGLAALAASTRETLHRHRLQRDIDRLPDPIRRDIGLEESDAHAHRREIDALRLRFDR